MVFSRQSVTLGPGQTKSDEDIDYATKRNRMEGYRIPSGNEREAPGAKIIDCRQQEFPAKAKVDEKA